MNQLNLRIELVEGSIIDVVTSAGDLVKWESKFDLGIDKLEKVTHLLYLAWLAVCRTNKVSTDFDSWIETVAKVEVSDPKA
jgi:hypothetical protein